jgi:hypothetical protein
MWSSVLLEKLIVSHLLKFHDFYGNRRLITVHKTRLLFLSCSCWISTYLRSYMFKIYYSNIPPSTCRSREVVSSLSVFQQVFYVYFWPSMHTTSHTHLLYLIAIVIFNEEYKLWSFYGFCYLFPPRSNYLFSTLFCNFLSVWYIKSVCIILKPSSQSSSLVSESHNVNL